MGAAAISDEVERERENVGYLVGIHDERAELVGRRLRQVVQVVPAELHPGQVGHVEPGQSAYERGAPLRARAAARISSRGVRERVCEPSASARRRRRRGIRGLVAGRP